MTKTEYQRKAVCCARSSTPPTQVGLSLIELMIAMALGLVITLGVTQIYLSGSATYRTTQGFANAQESTRFVAAILKPEIRQSGSFGCLAEMGRPLNDVVDNRLNGGLPVPINQAIQGWEFSASGPGDDITMEALADGVDSGNWSSGGGAALPNDLDGASVQNSDVFIINALTPISSPLKPGNPQNGNSLNLDDSSQLPAGSIVLATTGDCSLGELFQSTNNQNATSITMAGNNVAPGNNGNNFNLTYDDNTRVYEFISTAYYIGVGTSGEPSLFRRRMTPLQDPQELVSGVESLQVTYGVDTGNDGGVDAYIPADEVADWTKVISMRVAVLARSPDEVLDEINDRSFDLAGTEFNSDDSQDRRARIASVFTTALRTRM